MVTALRWLKDNNPQYMDIVIDEKFQFSDESFTIMNNKYQVMPAHPEEPDDHLLTLDLAMHATTEINIKQPAGTSVQHYILQDMKGNKIFFDLI